jgi:hypothetical protein
MQRCIVGDASASSRRSGYAAHRTEIVQAAIPQQDRKGFRRVFHATPPVTA